MAHASDRAAYRGDIDGLRAIAVLLVIGFHFFPRYVPGGFIGVDVFFVISGFLITRLICTGLEDGSFTLADFYARRIKRIFPALGVVLTVCLIAGWLLLFPVDYRDVGKHTAAAAVFIANFTFLQEAGYFDTSAELKPLLHLWSLGVEEQFYIVWPLLLVLAWRWRFPPFIVAVALLAVSFVLNVWLTGGNALAAFYLPFTRFWELMLGGILAIISLVAADRGGPSATIREAASLLGVALLAAAVLLISRERSFPGWWAALPTLGTALLVFGGPQTLFNRALAYRPLVYIGLISYPLYLWHWPILTFARHVQLKEPTNLSKLAYIVMAFALAHWTYRYVERPIRFGVPTPRKPIMLAAALAAIGCVGLLVYLADGFPRRYPSDVQTLFKDFRRDAEAVHGHGLCVRNDSAAFAMTTKCVPAAGQRQIVVWGDSHAAQLVRGLIELERGRGDIQVVSFSHGGCPPILSFVSAQVPDCASVNESVAQRIGQMKPDTVIMAGRWEWYDGSGKLDDQSIESTVARLKSAGVRRVVGVGQFPLWEFSVPKILARHYRTLRASFAEAPASDAPQRSKDHLVASAFAVNYKVGRAFLSAGAGVVSPASTLCNADGCLLTVPGLGREPIAGDQTHLTYAGSIFFASRNAEALVGN